MGYSGVRGGQEAIAAAERLVHRDRFAGSSRWLELDQITGRLGLAVDRVMGEAGLWAPERAARAIRQSRGDLLEAAQLLRAHRSTLPRLAYSSPVAATALRPVRRIAPAHRNPPGGQVLGITGDYTPRILDLTDEDTSRATPPPPRRPATSGAPVTAPDPIARPSGLPPAGLLADRRDATDPHPFDITRAPARPGAPRSARLSSMARAETGSLTHLWYLVTRAPRHDQPETPLELRRGHLPLRVEHPFTGSPVTVAGVRVTEARTVRPDARPRPDGSRFDIGYGLCLGDNEAKALAMAGLDLLVHRDGVTDRLEQQVLTALDGPEAAGYLEHLKLPHYVDFRSIVDRIRAVWAAAAGERS
ncbi:carbon-phosphorus lyase complex subunit PhnI [Streptomyces sp. 5-10]|uniref:carbon-phosphorus lyase complex subunit PhnI n=1 Tax=Streptomyces sp. 5-10 TaxID=878925 RepID=UPI00168BA6E0|nr:carbon-phosphorus lyase complex subunit PhnI [Streptomyces sp. 5-10]MBD3002591.1 carbon-phosphorus lyase complex subunit PhnI [Streptomyces sp. 5-10]